jgi:dTDP-4-amino-4,6-dideoxygalactose transaminase
MDAESVVTAPSGSVEASSVSATWTYRFVRAVCVPLIRVIFRPRVEGLEHLPERGGYLLASNQLSNLDGPAIGFCIPRQIYWMGKAELFVPILGGFFRRVGIFPVRRGTGDFSAIDTAVGFARAGHPVGIFPEGTRRAKGFRKKRAARPHLGAARVALTAGVPLVPVAIVGTDRLRVLQRWRIAFGPPISTEDLPEHPRGATREATSRLMDAIGAMEESLRSDRSLPRRLHPRLRLDIRLGDLAYALSACLLARWEGRERAVLRAAGGDEALVCLSVRSAFDLLLQALALEPGEEVLVSAVTHPDMVRIIEAHGLRAVPVDLDLETLAPRMDVAEQALTDVSRVLLVAHLFGGRCDLEPLAAFAKRHDLLLVEDCAQSYAGPGDLGSGPADVSLYSFGSIKTATALGGCVVRVADASLRSRMEELQGRYPLQARTAYARRVLKYTGLSLLGRPRAYSAFARSLARRGDDLDRVINGSVRGFTDNDLLPAIRLRPSAPLLALLARRLTRFDSGRLQRRADAGERVADALPPSLFQPGRSAQRKTHWVFPVVSGSPPRLVDVLRHEGFDAARATSGIGVVEAPSDRPELEPREAQRMLGGIVFLPAYPELADDLPRLIAAVAAAAE